MKQIDIDVDNLPFFPPFSAVFVAPAAGVALAAAGVAAAAAFPPLPPF